MLADLGDAICVADVYAALIVNSKCRCAGVCDNCAVDDLYAGLVVDSKGGGGEGGMPGVREPFKPREVLCGDVGGVEFSFGILVGNRGLLGGGVVSWGAIDEER
jgi:hypothetical protein